MKTIEVHASRSYSIHIASGLLDSAGELIRPLVSGRRAVVVSGEHVFRLYGMPLCSALERAGFQTLGYMHRSGEQNKTFANYERLLERLSFLDMGRSDLIVALGGGVTGDLAGFAAATYQRGMRFVQVPTSLLAMVDSSVGGKTAVNLNSWKNQVGCFYQPALVLCDPALLRTLPEREYRCGCAEVIKYAVLGDADFFAMLERKPISAQEEEVLARCIAMKRDIVERDEFDCGERQLLNLGHSFGHAVESCSRNAVAHGEAVAIGMAMIARAAAAKGILPDAERDRILALFYENGLPVDCTYSADALWRAMLKDKKRSGDAINLIVPERIGRCRIVKTPLAELEDWLRLGGAS